MPDTQQNKNILNDRVDENSRDTDEYEIENADDVDRDDLKDRDNNDNHDDTDSDRDSDRSVKENNYDSDNDNNDLIMNALELFNAVNRQFKQNYSGDPLGSHPSLMVSIYCWILRLLQICGPVC